jgi:putative ABC transport system substrate-binding protein
VTDRRTFLAVAATTTLLAAPLGAGAQPAGKVYRVGLIFPSPPVSEMAGPEPVNVAARAFVRGLRALGYVEGRNLILERRSAEGRFERFAPIVAELVSLNVDVIVVSSTSLAQRAREVTTAVPIVMGAVADPVGSGLAQSLGRPGGNVTGLTSDVGPEIHGKRLELLKGAVPRASRVAFLGARQLWGAVYEQSIKPGAKALGLTVFLAEHTPTDYTGAFTLIRRERPDALFVAPSSENYAQRRLIVDFATSNRLPNIHAFRESVEVGGLMSYGVNVADLFRRAAGYVDKILKGAKPGDLPVEQPTKFELVINLKTAKALGLTIPQSLLLRADQVIE